MSNRAAEPIHPSLGPPTDWTGTDARVSGAVVMPDHVDPTNPHRVYELDDRAQRKYLYEAVLTDGTPADINRIIDHTLLAELWDGLYLARNVRLAWADALSSPRPRCPRAQDHTPNRPHPHGPPFPADPVIYGTN